jgi:hypothetical protein
MKFHKQLVKITVAHLPICFAAFYALNSWQATNRETIAVNSGLGWIFWLGIFSFIAPVLMSDETRKELFQRQYFAGTLILAIINMLIAPACSIISAACVLQ